MEKKLTKYNFSLQHMAIVSAVLVQVYWNWKQKEVKLQLLVLMSIKNAFHVMSLLLKL